jgi:hypothetical protein
MTEAGTTAPAPTPLVRGSPLFSPVSYLRFRIVGGVQFPRGATGFSAGAGVGVRTVKTLGHSLGRVLEFRPAGEVIFNYWD